MTINPPKAYEGKEKYIFISYAHKDKEKVWPIIEKLNNEGYRVWYDDGIDPGTEWAKTIAEHLLSCHVFVSMISDNYLASQNCTDEMHYSRELKKKSLLVYLSDIEMPPELQMRFGMRQALHKYKYYKEDEFYRKFYKSDGFEECEEPSPKSPKETPPDSPPKKPEKEEPQTTDNIVKKPREVVIRPPRTPQKSPSSAETKEGNTKLKAGVIGISIAVLFMVFIICIAMSSQTTGLLINDGRTLTMNLGERIAVSDIKVEGEGLTEADIEDAIWISDYDWLVDVREGDLIATDDSSKLELEYSDGTVYYTGNVMVRISNDSGKWEGSLNVEVRANE